MLTLFSRRKLQAPTRSRKVVYRPRVEALEDRTAPATFAVTTTADVVDTGDGLLSLREAVLEANALHGADIIDVPAGTYILTRAGVGEDAAATGDLDITDDLMITGAGVATTIVDGAFLDRVFHILGADVTITAMSITHGIGEGGGGGIFNDGTLTVSASTISDNVATAFVSGNFSFPATGGGIHNSTGKTATVIASIISGNSAGNLGGGVFNGGRLSVLGSTITGNFGHTGGGIANAGNLDVTGSILSYNQASGLANHGAALVTTSTFSHNQSGGIYNGPPRTISNFGEGIAGGILTVVSCTVSENFGGGIYNLNGTLFVQNSTVSGNVDGGVFNDGIGRVMISRSTLSGNVAALGGAILNGRFATCSVEDSTLSGNVATLGSGGAIFNAGRLMLERCTLSDNSADADGGGIFNDAGGVGIIRDSTVCDNFAARGRDVFNLGVLSIVNSLICDLFDGS